MKASIARYSRARVDMVVSGALFVAAASILLATYGNYFPLIEYREIIQGEYGSAVGLPIAEQFTRFFLRLSTRQAAYHYGEAFGAVCGTNIPCLNFSFYVLPAAAIALGYLVARRLGARSPLAVAAMCFFALSPAALSVYNWQATLLDALALVMILASVLAALAIFARHVAGFVPAAVSAALLTLLTAVALKSKEIAFPLPAVLLLLALCDIGHYTSRFWRVVTVLPAVIYSAAFEFLYIRGGVHQRFIGGDPVANMIKISQTFRFGYSPPRPFLLIIGGAAATSVVIVAIYASIQRWGKRESAQIARGGMVLFVASAMFVVPCLPVAYVATFYLYVPTMFAALAYAVLASAITRGSKPAIIALMLPPLCAALGYYESLRAAAEVLLTGSRNFQASFPRLASEIQPRSDDVIVFVYERDVYNHFNYFFICSKPGYGFKKSAHDLWRFIDAKAEAPLLNASAASEQGCVEGTVCPDTPWTLCIRYGPRMTLIATERRADQTRHGAEEE